MAKDKSKKLGSTKTKSAQKISEPAQDAAEEVQQEPPPNFIKIEAVAYENIKTTYPVSDLTIKFDFDGATLYESSKTAVLSFDTIDIDFDFGIPCDLSNPKDRERFISSPLIVTVTETERIVDLTEVEILALEPKESVPSTGTATPKTSKTSKTKRSKSDLSDKKSKKGEKDKKGGKDKKGKKGSSKSSKGSSSKGTSASTLPPKPTGPIKLGSGKLDLLPLFLGYSFFSETLFIEQIPTPFDETATSLQNLLKVKIDVTLEGPAISDDTTTILYVTIESLYNIPTMVVSDFQYELCCLIPGETVKLEPLLFNKGRVVNENQKFKYKLWPRTSEEQVPIPSTYRIPDDLKGVKNLVNIDLDPVVLGNCPRIEWNIIKRLLLNIDQLNQFQRQLWKYRKIPIEIYITPPKEPANPEPETARKSAKKKTSSTKGSKKDKGSKSKVSVKTPTHSPEVSTQLFDTTVDYLHLIAFIDVGYLLYPGITKCRIACPLRTYQEVEALQEAGLDDSHFRPKPPPPPPVEIIADKKPDKKSAGKAKAGKGGKSSKSSKSTLSSKSSKTKPKGGKKEKGTLVEGTNLAEFLPPPPPPPPPPSKEVLNDEGQPAFIIVEIELGRPLSPKRELEELDEEMSKFLPRRPDLSKKLMSSNVAEGIYAETVRALLTDINLQYTSYLEEKKPCKCDSESFQNYLQQTGAYQTYLSTIVRSLSIMIPQKYGYKNGIFTSVNEYQLFVADVYVDVIQEMNKIVNEHKICHSSSDEHAHYAKNDKILLYAKEAMELGEKAFAERYFLERICCREDQADCWFDYAVFLLEVNDLEKATECVTEAIQLDLIHKHSLMMYGLLLSDRNMVLEGETCLLRMIIVNPTWIEGWVVLFSFYKRVGNIEGADYCLDMAKKEFSENDTHPLDDFSCIDDLAWSTEKLSEDIFLRAAALLIKMRLYEHAERVMMCCIFTQKGLCKYLQGVIAYFKQDYALSMKCLQKADKILGLDFGICSLMGHCSIKLNDSETALKHFEIVLTMFNRPEDIHLVYINAAMAYDMSGNSQKARQLALLACKLSPTPQSWLFAGGFYFTQNDLMSAEECLIQANLCDNRLPDVWAYLALINAYLGNPHQCDLCMTQAKKYNTEDKPLVENIQGMIQRFIKSRK